MKDPIYPLTDRPPMPLEKARKIMSRLRDLCREANVAIVIPRQVKPPARVEFPVNVDMVIGLYKPSDADTQIEMHVLKSRASKAPHRVGDRADCCDDAHETISWFMSDFGSGPEKDGWAIPIHGGGDCTMFNVTFCPFCGTRFDDA